MRLKLASALLAFSSLAVSACGFTPVYGNLDGEPSGTIRVSEISGAAGHALRQEIILLLRPGIPGVEAGTLNIIVEEKTSPFVIGADATNVRTIVRNRAEYTFISNAGEFSGKVKSENSFYASDRTMNEILAKRQASELAAKESARKIVSELISKVARQKEENASKVKN